MNIINTTLLELNTVTQNVELRFNEIYFLNLKYCSIDFKANPNSKTLYVRIKDKLKSEGVSFDGNNKQY